MNDSKREGWFAPETERDRREIADELARLIAEESICPDCLLRYHGTSPCLQAV